ncbi:hypothetical protein M0812_08842 [Anaeramoeba flamelloides]|uniref:Uncharacterized protein n=1 Tax=Anaeramoeba flamelloides TaxID=1746091 RepID=A0AAV8A2G7_9EUKA|nr:hypothetical protein M0812_08842 [Anaeramoeba flamelloides]
MIKSCFCCLFFLFVTINCNYITTQNFLVGQWNVSSQEINFSNPISLLSRPNYHITFKRLNNTLLGTIFKIDQDDPLINLLTKKKLPTKDQNSNKIKEKNTIYSTQVTFINQTHANALITNKLDKKQNQSFYIKLKYVTKEILYSNIKFLNETGDMAYYNNCMLITTGKNNFVLNLMHGDEKKKIVFVGERIIQKKKSYTNYLIAAVIILSFLPKLLCKTNDFNEKSDKEEEVKKNKEKQKTKMKMKMKNEKQKKED